MKTTMPAVTAAASVRTVRLGGWNDAAKRKRQYGITRSSATSDLATIWWRDQCRVDLDRQGEPAEDGEGECDPSRAGIRWRTHCSAVSAANKTNSTRETFDRT